MTRRKTLKQVIAWVKKRGGVAVLGCGYQGRETHARVLREHGVLTAVGDVREESARMTGNRFGVRAVWGSDALDQLLAVKPAAVVIAAPNSQHATLAVRALNHGADVLVEKPFGLSLQEVASIFQAAELNGRVVDCHHTLQACIPEVSNLAEQMRFGRMESDWFRADGIPQTVELPEVLWDLEYHLLYWHRLFLPDRVPTFLNAQSGRYGHRPVDDRVRANIHYPGVTAESTEGALIGRGLPPLDVTLACRFVSPSMALLGRPEELTLTAEGPSGDALLVRLATATGASEALLARGVDGKPSGIQTYPGLSVNDAQARAVEHFLRLLVGDVRPYLTEAEARLQITVLKGIETSIANDGHRVDLVQEARSRETGPE